MSLLDGPETVFVQRRSQTRDGARGAAVLTKVGAPIKVERVTVRPMSAVEIDNAGLQSLNQHIVVSRTWPGDINSLVIWGGFDWDTIGDPPFYPGSRLVRHWEVQIEKRGVHVG